MYINIIHYKSLEGDQAKSIIEELNRLKNVVAELRPDGFIQAYFVRDRKGDPAILSMWRSRRHLKRFLESGEGKEAAEIQVKLVTDAIGAEEFESSWQARYTDGEISDQLGGYK